MLLATLEDNSIYALLKEIPSQTYDSDALLSVRIFLEISWKI